MRVYVFVSCLLLPNGAQNLVSSFQVIRKKRVRGWVRSWVGALISRETTLARVLTTCPKSLRTLLLYCNYSNHRLVRQCQSSNPFPILFPPSTLCSLYNQGLDYTDAPMAKPRQGIGEDKGNQERDRRMTQNIRRLEDFKRARWTRWTSSSFKIFLTQFQALPALERTSSDKKASDWRPDTVECVHFPECCSALCYLVVAAIIANAYSSLHIFTVLVLWSPLNSNDIPFFARSPSVFDSEFNFASRAGMRS